MESSTKRPRFAKAPTQHIMKLFLGKKYEDCLKLIDSAFAMTEDTTQLKILQAGCWTQMDINHEIAVEQLNEVIQADPNNAFAHYGLGLNFYRRGELDKCLDPFTTAAALDSSTMSRAAIYKDSAMKVLKLLRDAKLEFTAGRCLKALELLSLAVLVDPDNDAIKQLVKQQSDKIIQKVVFGLQDEVLAKEEDNEKTLNHVSFLVKSGKYEAANKIIPDDEQLRNARGWYLKGFVKYMMGSLKLSLVYIKNALDLDETMQEAQDVAEKAEKFIELIQEATDQMKLKENDKAVELLTSALEVDEENHRIIQAIYFQRAVAKFNAGNQKEAFDDYLHFESLQNKTGMIMDGIKF